MQSLTRASTRTVICGVLLVLNIAAHADGIPVLIAELPRATITFVFPAAALAVGDEKPFTVKVVPKSGNSPPVRVRGRFGMPYMHHWVTDEQVEPYSEPGIRFLSNISMLGVYRFRVWLDYADGTEARAAVDFKVMVDETLGAEVVPE